MQKLNERFAHVMPELSAHEFTNLTESIREKGCLFPITVWGDTIVDGHNRYRICRELGVPFQTKEVTFADDVEAIAWIIDIHFSRRNLSPFQRCEAVIKYEPEIKAAVEKRRRAAISIYRSTGVKVEQYSKRTASILADMAGVAKDTLYRVKKILKIGDEETKRRLRAGEISISYAYYSLIAKTESAESIDTVASPVPSNEGSNDSECSNGDSNDTKLLLINKNVKRLIEMVETGDAAPNVIIQELKTLLDMTV